MSWAIECIEVGKQYRRGAALDGFTMRVEPGTVVGFLGPNGAGKTTAMRIIMGLARPSSGSVKVLGGEPGSPDVLARSGAVIEAPALFGSMSAQDHLRTVAAWAGVPEAQCAVVLGEVGLGTVGRKPCRTFSQGMKQRLSLAAALLKDPELLVLDEPVNGLDPQGVAEIRSLIRRLQSEGRTILVSSHLLGEIERCCDRIAVISAGRIVAYGSLAEISALGQATDHCSALEDAYFKLTRKDQA